MAAVCASSVYEGKESFPNDSLSFTKHESWEASWNGDIKATAMTVVQSSTQHTAEKPLKSAFVVAIRGTSSVVEHLVNLNCEADDARDFLVSLIRAV